MLKNILKISALSTTFAMSALSNAQSFQPNIADYLTMTMDITGSMHAVRSADGLTRCEFAKNQMKSDLERAMVQSKNVQIVSFDTSTSNVTGGFIDTSNAFSKWFGDGQVIYNDLVGQIDAMSCGHSATALADSVCEVIDELYEVNTNGLKPIIAIYTDGGENASNPNICGGSDYIDKVGDKMEEGTPMVHLNVTYLQAPGNVSLSFSKNGSLVTENALANLASVPTAKNFSNIDAEREGLRILSLMSGGNFHTVTDDDPCYTGCSALSEPSDDDDPWTGGGFGR